MKYPQEEIRVRAKNFWEFRRLLKLLYSMGYTFGTDKYYSAFTLYYTYGWFRGPVNGLSLYEGLRLKYIDKDFDIDCVDVEEFNNWLAGNI